MNVVVIDPTYTDLVGALVETQHLSGHNRDRGLVDELNVRHERNALGNVSVMMYPDASGYVVDERGTGIGELGRLQASAVLV
jgi:hypothetical protein